MDVEGENPGRWPYAGEFPAWWPYGGEFPAWTVWRGVDRLYYARLPGADPPLTVRGEDPVDLRDQIRARS